jgi:hypothetical protein
MEFKIFDLNYSDPRLIDIINYVLSENYIIWLLFEYYFIFIITIKKSSAAFVYTTFSKYYNGQNYIIVSFFFFAFSIIIFCVLVCDIICNRDNCGTYARTISFVDALLYYAFLWLTNYDSRSICNCHVVTTVIYVVLITVVVTYSILSKTVEIIKLYI